MAQKLDYSVPAAPQPGAKEEWDALLEVLHRSGTLRFLRGFFGQLGPVSGVALREANSEAGRNLMGGILAVGQILVRVDVDQDAKLALGIAAGAGQSRYASKPPGLLKLLRILRAPDTRRALGTILQLLSRIGAALRQPVPNQPKK